MNVFATLRQFFVAIIILLCSASAEALPLRTTTAASTNKDMNQTVGKSALSPMYALSLLASATYGPLPPSALISCSTPALLMGERNASVVRIEGNSAKITDPLPHSSCRISFQYPPAR